MSFPIRSIVTVIFWGPDQDSDPAIGRAQYAVSQVSRDGVSVAVPPGATQMDIFLGQGDGGQIHGN